jgi:signal transduction histidine kinase
MSSIAFGGAPLEVVIAAVLLSIYGAAAPIELPGGRLVFVYTSTTAIALFALAGPASILVTVVGPLSVSAARVLTRAEGSRTRELLTQTVLLVIALLAVDSANQLLGGAKYPLALTSWSHALRTSLVLCTAYGLFTGFKELIALVRRCTRGKAVRHADSCKQGSLERRLPIVPIYMLYALYAGPVQLLALAIYPSLGRWSWILIMSSGVMIRSALGMELSRVRRLRTVLADRAAQARIDALSEVTIRVAHQMRHQLGLIGLSLHRIDAHLVSCGMAGAGPVREELENLARAREELRSVLAEDLHEVFAPNPKASWAAVIRGPLARFGLLARERGITMIEDVAHLPTGEVRHARRLEQAWFNVVENAISAARSRVSIAVRVDRSELMLSVEDDGPGMNDEVFARATEPFFSTKPDGTGLGLAIARAVAEDLGGELAIERATAGMRVSIRLPRDRASAMDSGVEEHA